MSEALKDFTVEEMEAEIKRRKEEEEQKNYVKPLKELYQNPVSLWKVTTEGDCEGRSIRHLGMFNGHFIDVALKLKHQATHQLYLTAVDPRELERVNAVNEPGTVDISFSSASGIYDMTKKEILYSLMALSKKEAPLTKDWEMGVSTYYNAVKIIKK